jgi:hypothetical protein
MASPHRLSVEPELWRLSASRTLNRTSVSNTSDLVSTEPSASMPSRRVASARLPIGVLLYLVSVGFVGAATVGLFFGSGLLLLAQQMHTESGTHEHDAYVDPLRSTKPSAGAENGAPSIGGVPTLSPTAGEAAIIAPTQTDAADEPGLRSRIASASPLSSMASEAAIIAPTQTAAAGEPAPSSRVASIPPPGGGGSDHLRKLSRPPHSRSDAVPGEARATAGRTRSAKPPRSDSPEEHAAASANQQEYNQLYATGPAVNLSSASPSADDAATWTGVPVRAGRPD